MILGRIGRQGINKIDEVVYTRRPREYNELYPMRRTIIFSQRVFSRQRVVSGISRGAEHYNVCFRCEIKIGVKAFPIHKILGMSAIVFRMKGVEVGIEIDITVIVPEALRRNVTLLGRRDNSRVGCCLKIILSGYRVGLEGNS